MLTPDLFVALVTQDCRVEQPMEKLEMDDL
jgi:hypothetical protein